MDNDDFTVTLAIDVLSGQDDLRGPALALLALQRYYESRRRRASPSQ